LLTAPVAALESRQLLSAAPAGPEFRINTHTTSNQQAPAVAMDADGDFVAVWISQGQDGSDFGIYGQRFNASGASQGSEFRVNVHTPNAQRDAAVAMDANGNFVVVWASQNQVAAASDYDVFGRRYSTNGDPLGGEFQINVHTTGAQRAPRVAADNEGNFVVVWQSDMQEGGGYGVYARRYNAAGAALGGEFLVNSYTTNNQLAPAVAMDADGDFAIVWTSSNQDGHQNGVYGQRYNAVGEAQGIEFRVNAHTTGNQRAPAIAMDAAGHFVVTWTSANQVSSTSADDIYARRYAANGTTLGGEFLVNTSTTGNQQAPSIAMDAAGDFVIVWRSAHINPTFGDDIYAQQFAAEGTPVGSQFRVNTHTSNQQFRSAVAMDADGDFVVVWDSYGQVNHPNLSSLYDIYAQRYEQPVTVGFTITQTGLGTSVSEHGSVGDKTDTFDVVLDAAPASNVVLNVVSNDTSEATVNVATLTFTPGNWNVAQTVTVSGVFDNLTDGNQNTTITVSVNVGLSDPAYAAVPGQNIVVTVEDVPNRPVIVGPIGAGQSNPVTFVWNGDDVVDETSFALWLINKTTGGLVYQNAALAANSTSFELPLTLDPGEYRFWINSVSANGYSQSGAPTDFSVGAALTPPTTPTGFDADFTGNPLRPQISWSNIAGATYSIYLIRLADSAVIASASGLTNPHFTPGVDLADGPHRIWVRAHNAAGSSAWSTPFDFTVGPVLSPPAAPTGFFLTNGETTTPTINWGAVPTAATYSIYFIRLADGALISGATGLTDPHFTPGAPLSSGMHRIWVKAHNAAGSSAWSTPYDFTVGTPIVPPTAPTGFMVTDANTANPTVTWASQGAGVTYSIWFINLDTGALISGASGLTTNSFTASGLTTNRYRIWVKAHNTAGSSSWSSPFDFDVAVM
jgi:hypothetical protein